MLKYTAGSKPLKIISSLAFISFFTVLALNVNTSAGENRLSVIKISALSGNDSYSGFDGSGLSSSLSFKEVLEAAVAELQVSKKAAKVKAVSVESSPAETPAVEIQQVKPGTKISPQFSDPGRTALILKIISDIYNGRPLQFPKDGTIFTNIEKVLPINPDPKYYKEYTVLPPAGSPSTITIGDKEYTVPPPQGHRGAERLVIGGGQNVYYTPDHYRTFIQIYILP